MTQEQLFAALLLLIGALYAGLIWEVRSLRKAKHDYAQFMQWASMAIGFIARHLNIKIDPPKVDE